MDETCLVWTTAQWSVQRTRKKGLRLAIGMAESVDASVGVPSRCSWRWTGKVARHAKVIGVICGVRSIPSTSLSFVYTNRALTSRRYFWRLSDAKWNIASGLFVSVMLSFPHFSGRSVRLGFSLFRGDDLKWPYSQLRISKATEIAPT